jgi:phosphonate transport system substrate-binding protein
MKTLVQKCTVAAFIIFAAVFLLCSCDNRRETVNLQQATAPATPSGAKDQRPPLTIAVGAMLSPDTTRVYYEELLGLIAARMGRRPVFAQRRTYAEVNDMVRKRDVDLAFVCAGPYTEGKRDCCMEMLVVPVANGKTVYHSYIIVPKSSNAGSLADLRGKKFAFTDPQSNTGALVPTYMLARRGETPKSFFDEFFYSHSHDNSIRAVANGQADGAAVDSLIWYPAGCGPPGYGPRNEEAAERDFPLPPPGPGGGAPFGKDPD